MRCGSPSTVTPSQSAMGVLADQFSSALPDRASPDARSALQSDTSPALLAVSATADPVAQAFVLIRDGVPLTVLDQGPAIESLTART